METYHRKVENETSTIQGDHYEVGRRHNQQENETYAQKVQNVVKKSRKLYLATNPFKSNLCSN